MSRCPVPTHLEKKNRRPSGDNAGPASLSDVLTGGPRFTAVSHGPSRDARVATQRSKLSWQPSGVSVPSPPRRVDVKYSASSSLESVGVWSWQAELTGASRCTGADHSEVAKDMAWSLTPTGADWDSHAASSVEET